MSTDKLNLDASSVGSGISDTDYIDIPRICELAYELLGRIPETSLTQALQSRSILDMTGELMSVHISPVSPIDSVQWTIRRHFTEVFEKLIPLADFKNLDDLLNRRALKSPNFIGTYCHYVGGLYGRSPKPPITETSPITVLFLRRKGFYVEWQVKPQLLTSSTSASRLSERAIFLIYGKIRTVGKKEISGKTHIQIDIRPYIFGSPEKAPNRRPAIAYIKEQDDRWAEEISSAGNDEQHFADTYRTKLRRNLAEHFNKDDLSTLCSDMGIEYENLAADTLDGMARELVAYYYFVSLALDKTDR
jgi:hypothetical protein